MATHSPKDVAAAIKAYDVRGVVGEGAGFLNEEFVRDVAASFARLMREEGAETIVIGHDMRDSSPSLAHSILSQGTLAHNCEWKH